MDIADMEMITVGKISGIFGVKGWVKIFSHTQPRDNILKYDPWYLNIGGQWQARTLVEGRTHGKGIVAHIEGLDDRDLARELLDVEIAIRRDQLPKLHKGEYYWTDLEGLEVVTTDGMALGKISHLFETGANDVMVVTGERERLIPFIQHDVVKEINLDDRCMVVDWPPDF